MSTENIAHIVEKMGRLSEEEQRTLAATVLQSNELEAFVEELEDHLNCENAIEEGSPEPLKLN
jgi:cell division protein FtsB